ncbi:MAG: DUF1972 domain-containing protein [Candidatus Omnitrophota bacterium]|nr:DUF1972 domain-containing protein [Candidatus Omnitrophota bacterium]
MKIAIIGTRGIPANYGGFETFAEELSARLVQKGHAVTVYCRSSHAKKNLAFYKGVRLVVLPTIRHKYLDTVANTFLAVWHVLFTDTEVIYFCNAVNSVFTIIPRLFGKKTLINVDGLEWKRKKWNDLAKAVYKISERIATIFPNAIVTDSKAMQLYYKKTYGKDTEYISYGADMREHLPAGPVMVKYKLQERNFILYVSRLEPENNAHILIEAYEKVKGDMPLVIVGDAPYAKGYIEKIKSTKDDRIKFIGSVYKDGYFELLSNAFLYVHGNEVGGTNPALLQAMASGNCVIVNGIDFNKEVIGDSGLWFRPNDADDLKQKIKYLLDHREEAGKYRRLAIDRIRKYYSWDETVNKTEELMKRLRDGK